MGAKAAFIKFVVQQYDRKLTKNGANGASIDKISKLLDMLDKHIKEQNCRHTPNELLQEYQNFE